MKEKIEELKNSIEEYLNNGGNLYGRVVDLPYYLDLQEIILAYKLKGIEKTQADIYAMCGIEYDQEYGYHLKVMHAIEKYADKNGNISSIRKHKYDDKKSYNLLRKIAEKYGVSMFDYVACMTDYFYDYAFVRQNQIAFVEARLKRYYKQYGDIRCLKKVDPRTYEVIRIIQKRLGENFTIPDVLEYFGYKSVIKDSTNDISPYLDKFKNTFLSVDENNRYARIMELKQELNAQNPEPLSPVKKFRQDLKNMQIIVDTLNREYELGIGC